jgi:hypothetical protein
MDHARHRSMAVRRIELPSGKTVEISRPEPDDRRGASGPAVRAAPRLGGRAPGRVRPNLCRGCASTLAYEVDCRSAPGGRWEIDVRCPNCEQTDTVTLTQTEADSLDAEFERAAEALVRDLARLAEANMTEDLERFVAALEADAIHPIDF